MSSRLFPVGKFLVCLLIWFVVLGLPNVANHFLNRFLPATASAVTSVEPGPLWGKKRLKSISLLRRMIKERGSPFSWVLHYY